MASNEEPPERDVKDFEFRQLCKFRVFPSSDINVPFKRTQQLATSSKFGLIFAAANNEIKMMRLAMLSQQDQCVDVRERSTMIADVPCDKHFTVDAFVVHIAVSSDDLTLAVVTDDESSLHLLLFSLRSLADQNATPMPFAKYQFSVNGTTLRDLTWNPAFPTLLAVCLSNNTVTLLDITDHIAVKANAALPATCLSWSPRGKQIMVGKSDGSCSQYDHDLNLKKDWPSPAILTVPYQITDVLWISTYTFLASYLPPDAEPVFQPIMVMTISNKEGNSTFINFDDVCYGSGENRLAKYFFHYLMQWEMIIVTSSAATETAIVAKHLEDRAQWEHWILEDDSRAELPVTENQTDSFPLGMCIIFSSQQIVQLGDNKTHPPCPILLLLSTDGVLVPFHMVYFHPQAVSLTAAPQTVTAEGTPRLYAGGELTAPVPQAATTVPSSRPILSASSGLSVSAGADGGNIVRSGQAVVAWSNGSQSVAGHSVSTFPNFSFAPTKVISSAALGEPAVVKPAASFPATHTTVVTQSAGATVKMNQSNTFSSSLNQTGETVSKSFPLPAHVNKIGTVGLLPSTGTQSTAKGSGNSEFKSTVAGDSVSRSTDRVTEAGSLAGGGSGLFSFSFKPTVTTPPLVTPVIPSVAAVSATKENGLTAGTNRVATSLNSTGRVEQEIDAVLDTTVMRNIAEEMEDFEKELLNLRLRMSQNGPVVGTKEEMQTLILNTNKLVAFCKEISSTTKEHCLEAHDLKSSCLDLFAMAEECRCRQQRNHDPHYLRALQQRTLNPATTKRMHRLQQSVQQIVQALHDADTVLDSQWEAHKEKEKKMRIRIPNSDTLYRAIKSNHNVLISRQRELERLQDQLRRLQIKNQVSNWENYPSFDNVEGEIESSDHIPPARDWRLKKADLLTPEKVSLLKESLASHHVLKVRCQPLRSFSQSQLVSVINEQTASPVVSSDDVIQATSNSVKEAEVNSQALSSGDGRAAPIFTSAPATEQPYNGPSKVMQPPTSFSGVAFFKQKTSVEESPKMFVSAGPATGTVAQRGFVAAVPAGPGAFSKNPQVQGLPLLNYGTSYAAYATSQQHSVPRPYLDGSSQGRYENVTPTDFADEDEDDDYVGYEENEEDEEEEDDEEEAGFGDQYEYPPEDSFNGIINGQLTDMGSSTPLSALQTGVTASGKPAGSGVNKNLFIVPPAVSEAVNRSSVTTSGFGFSAVKTSSRETATTCASAFSSAFGTKVSAVSDITSVTSSTPATTVASSKPVGGLFTFSTVPATTVASPPGVGLFGAVTTFSSPSTIVESVPSSPPVGYFAKAEITTAESVSPQASSIASSTSTLSSAGFSAFAGVPAGFGSLVKPQIASTTASAAVELSQGSLFGKPQLNTTPLSATVTTLASTAALATVTTASNNSSTTTSNSSPILFGSSSATTSSSTLFGSTSQTTAASSPVASTMTTSAGSFFGSVTTTTSSVSAGSVFGSGSSTTTLPSAGLFAAPVTVSTASSGGTFGSVTSTTPSSGGLFGSVTSTTPSSGGLFGAVTSTTPSSGGLFGAVTSTTPSSGGLFGSVISTTTSDSLFTTSFSANAPAHFGSSESAVTSRSPLFENPSSTASSPFAASTGQSSIFQSAAETASSASLFTTASPVVTTSSTFGFGQSAVFGGFTKPSFGSAPAFGQSSAGFGQAGGGGFGQTSSGTGFGSSGGFGQTATEPESGGSFGGLFGGGGGLFGLGAKPSEEKAKQNVFGTTQAFATSPAASSSLFGSKGPAAFDSSNQTISSTGVFGGSGSQFSGTTSGAGVASMGFAVPQSTANTPAFGGSPAFGGRPAFGGSPTFGSAAAFGSSANFGASTVGGATAFGSTPAFPSPFGSAQQTASTGGFSNFAATNSPTFGSLAQSSDASTFGSIGQGNASGFATLASQGGGFGTSPPAFGGQQQQPSGFGSTSFGSSPSFSSYRG